MADGECTPLQLHSHGLYSLILACLLWPRSNYCCLLGEARFLFCTDHISMLSCARPHCGAGPACATHSRKRCRRECRTGKQNARGKQNAWATPVRRRAPSPCLGPHAPPPEPLGTRSPVGTISLGLIPLHSGAGEQFGGVLRTRRCCSLTCDVMHAARAGPSANNGESPVLNGQNVRAWQRRAPPSEARAAAQHCALSPLSAPGSALRP